MTTGEEICNRILAYLDSIPIYDGSCEPDSQSKPVAKPKPEVAQASKKKGKKKNKKKKEKKKKPPQGPGKKKAKKKLPKVVAPTYDNYDGPKPSLSEPMAPKYEPALVESYWDEHWARQGYYKPEINSDKKPFVMMIPPPNVTGSLHLGHALMLAVEDAMTRYWRMKGRNCLWLPGTDHAGIATQSVVERMLARENITRHQLGREPFLEKVWEWKHKYGGHICSQIRKMGSSVDWDREVFTMDKKLNKAVVEAFVRMFESGKIYRENRLCNWSCKLNSAIADCEVDKINLEQPEFLAVPGHKKKVEFGVIHSFAYQVKDSKDEIVVATTRIETMLGDTAVAVHPEDPRYKKYHGKSVIHPFNGRELPIVCDAELVKMDFGTGAVKITPAHDPNDFEMGLKHGLEFITIFAENGTINELGGQFADMPRFEARLAVIEELTKRGLFRGKENNVMALGICQRSGDVIEPRLMPQWWVDCREMAKRSTDAVREDRLKISPETGEKTYFEYLDNIRPWCISRQLWWGHRIPAYLMKIDGEFLDDTKTESYVVGRSEEDAMKYAKKKYPNAKNIELAQDEDVLDTWFSSGLFPFSTLGWPNQTDDLKNFFPGQMLETGGDIIFFWVARMVMMSLELMDELPFTEVFLHPLVRDRHGGKMSKTKGNVIDPLHIISGVELQVLVDELYRGNIPEKEAKKAEKNKREEFPSGIEPCGADALRFGLLDYLSQGRGINLDVNRVVSWRKFGNKMWQAQNFVNMVTPPDWTPSHDLSSIGAHLTRPVDRWVLGKLNELILISDDRLAVYDYSPACQAFYDFYKKAFCDVYLECIKPVFPFSKEGEDPVLQDVVQNVLYICLETSYRLLHPFMPFITEELWQRLPGDKGGVPSVMVASYPSGSALPLDATIDENMKKVQDCVSAILSIKDALNLPGKSNPQCYVMTPNALDEAYLEYISVLAKVGPTSMASAEDSSLNSCFKSVLSAYEIVYVENDGSVSMEKEIQKVQRRLEKKRGEVEAMEKKVNNPKAPEHVRAKFRTKYEARLKEFQEIEATLASYQSMCGSN